MEKGLVNFDRIFSSWSMARTDKAMHAKLGSDWSIWLRVHVIGLLVSIAIQLQYSKYSDIAISLFCDSDGAEISLA